ncbi:unnamed protein product, partial [Symbiodinium sp. KB8]
MAKPQPVKVAGRLRRRNVQAQTRQQLRGEVELGEMLTDTDSNGHDGPVILSEIRDMIWQELRSDVMQKLSQSPAFCVSIDEKDAKLVVLLTYLDVSAEQRETIPIAYHMLPGLEASDVADVVKQAEKVRDEMHMASLAAVGRVHEEIGGDGWGETLHNLESVISTLFRKLYRSFNAVLAHLHYAFSHHVERESKKTVRWMFLLLCSWPTKVLLAAVVDILSLCSACKNSLEGDISLDEVATSVSKLKCECDLVRYCEQIEECCAEYRALRVSKLRLRYEVTGGISKEYWCEMKDLGSPAEIKELLRTIRSFAEQTLENLVVRFGDVPLVLAHQILSPRWSFKQPDLVESAKALAAFWKVDEQALVSQLRAAFAIRDSLISEDSALKTARSKEVWLRVLSRMTSSDSDAVAREIIASFLVIQPQSAACERAFATVEEYKPLKEACASGFIKRVLGRFSATERRTALRR